MKGTEHGGLVNCHVGLRRQAVVVAAGDGVLVACGGREHLQ